MAKFFLNKAKDVRFSHLSFRLNFNYYFLIFFKKDIDFYLISKIINKLSIKFSKFITIFYKNIYYTQKYLILVNNKNAKLINYNLSNKIWLNVSILKFNKIKN